VSPELLTFQEGESLCSESEVCAEAFLIRSGKVRLSRKMGEMEIPYSLLGPGEILGAEAFDKSRILEYSALALDKTTVLPISQGYLLDVKRNVETWLVPWIYDYINRYNISERPSLSNIATLYSICNLFHSFLKIVNIGKSNDVLEGLSRPIQDEIRKNRSSTRYLVEPVVNGLVQVGLIDNRTNNPGNPAVVLPDEKLFMGFLIFIQNAADLEAGLQENVFVLSPLKMHTSAEILLDGILMDHELAGRLFEDERSMVHLSHERLFKLFEKARNGSDNVSLEKGIDGLEKYGTFRKVFDNENVSFFLHLRNILRLNIRRDPVGNFVDILDFLLEQMYDARYTLRNNDVILNNDNML